MLHPNTSTPNTTTHNSKTESNFMLQLGDEDSDVYSSLQSNSINTENNYLKNKDNRRGSSPTVNLDDSDEEEEARQNGLALMLRKVF